MTAKEMFEKLGYKYIRLSENSVQVENNDKLIYQFYPFENEIIFYVVNANKNDISFTSKELQAINQQCKELGWLEDK